MVDPDDPRQKLQRRIDQWRRNARSSHVDVLELDEENLRALIRFRRQGPTKARRGQVFARLSDVRRPTCRAIYIDDEGQVRDEVVPCPAPPALSGDVSQ